MSQVLGDEFSLLAAAVDLGLQTIKSGAESGISGKPRSWQRNKTRTLSKACTCASPKRKAEARCPATSMGRATCSNTSSPIEQSWDTVWIRGKDRLAWKP